MNQGRGDGGNRIHISLIRPIYFVDVANIAIDPVQKPQISNLPGTTQGWILFHILY
jgi:hypothetical protein